MTEGPAPPEPLGRSVVLFDLDGTLVDSREDILDAFLAAASLLRPGRAIEREAVVAHVGWPLGEMAARLGLGLGEEDVGRFEDAYRARYDALAAARTRPFPGVPELLAGLAGRALGLVTAKIERQALMVLEAVGLSRHFAHVQGWAPGVRHKPDPHLVELALARLGAGREDAVLVGDTDADVLAGRAAGVATVAVTWGFGTREALDAARPTRVVESVSELARILGR